MSKYGVFPGQYFIVFGLNTEICLNLCFQSEYGKMRTTKNFVFEHFFHDDNVTIKTGRSILSAYSYFGLKRYLKISIKSATLFIPSN